MRFFENYLDKKEGKRIYLIAFIGILTGLSASFIDTIWALYIESFVHSAFLVGLLTSLITAITFISYFFVIPLVEKKDKVRLYSLSLAVFFLSYILFAFKSDLVLFIIVLIPLGFFSALRVTSFGLLIKDSSNRKNLAKNEGLLYSLENIAWVLGPLIAGYILNAYDFGLVFFISALILLLVFFVINLSKIKDTEIKEKIDGNVMKNFFDFFKKKDRVFAYFLSGGVSFWWSLIYIFIPVYIVENGFSELLVGYFLFAIPIPLVFLEFYFSSLASKKGFKKILRVGYFITGIFALGCFFVTNIYSILGLLVLASFGMAMLESTTEAYFFDILGKKQHLRFYGPFNTADSLNSFIARILASFVLFFLPFRFLFILFGIFMFGYSFMTFFVRDSIESRRR